MKKDELPPNLGLPEQFFLLLMDIPDVETRLKCWLFKQTFTGRFVEVKQSVENLLRACVAVKKSTKLKKVLEIILAFGNFLNHDTQRGGCWGYRLSDLHKLVDLRAASDPQLTVFHFVIEYMEAAYPLDCDFHLELKSLEEASDLQQLSFIRDELNELKDGVKTIDAFSATGSSAYGSFQEVMSKFTPTSKKLIEKIEELLDKGEKLFKEIVSFFGEPATSSLDEFFGEIYRFGILFERTKVEIQRKRELATRQRQRQEQLESKKHQFNSKMPMGRLEQAIADLTSGNAYTAGKQNKGRQPPVSQGKEPFDFSPYTAQEQPVRVPRTASSRADKEEPALSAQATTPKGGQRVTGTSSNPLVAGTARSATPRTGAPRNAATQGPQKDQLAAALAFLKK